MVDHGVYYVSYPAMMITSADTFPATVISSVILYTTFICYVPCNDDN